MDRFMVESRPAAMDGVVTSLDKCVCVCVCVCARARVCNVHLHVCV